MKISDQFCPSAQRLKPYSAVTQIMKISGGANRLIAYQRSGIRHRRLRNARSRTPVLPMTRAVTMKAGTAEPRTFSSTRAASLRPGVIRGWVSALGTNTSAVVVTHASTKSGDRVPSHPRPKRHPYERLARPALAPPHHSFPDCKAGFAQISTPPSNADHDDFPLPCASGVPHSDSTKC